MDCPVCKYPNAAGATHCGMCYEVFNRSAAQNYQHAVKRERRLTEGNPPEPEAVIKSERVVKEVESVISSIDWQRLGAELLSLFKKSRKSFAIAAGVVALWMILGFIFSAGLWYHLLGNNLLYAFSEKVPAQYLVGMKTSVKSWSERNARLDTPMEHYKIDEIGNVLLQKTKTTSKNPRKIVVASTKEWIQISNDAGTPISRTIPKKHPSLADVNIVFNKKGVVLERRFMLSPRLSKSIPFLVPRFPPGRLRHGRQWTEDVAWLDVYNDWQIEWKATFHWTMGELVPCREYTCAQLNYMADLVPILRGIPEWAKGAVRQTEVSASGEGEVFFDASHKRLLSNTFSYDGLLRIPINNLDRIPDELRIGRSVRGPGEIVFHFENKIDINRN